MGGTRVLANDPRLDTKYVGHSRSETFVGRIGLYRHIGFNQLQHVHVIHIIGTPRFEDVWSLEPPYSYALNQESEP